MFYDKVFIVILVIEMVFIDINEFYWIYEIIWQNVYWLEQISGQVIYSEQKVILNFDLMKMIFVSCIVWLINVREVN